MTFIGLPKSINALRKINSAYSDLTVTFQIGPPIRVVPPSSSNRPLPAFRKPWCKLLQGSECLVCVQLTGAGKNTPCVSYHADKGWGY